MRVVSRMSAIVTALAVLAGASLSGCGQRGALYLPTVPPLPPKPVEQTRPVAPNAPQTDNESATRPASDADANDVPAAPLSLTPDDQWHGSAPAAASDSGSTSPQ